LRNRIVWDLIDASDSDTMAKPPSEEPSRDEEPTMKYPILKKTALYLSLGLAVITPTFAQAPLRGLYGDWNIEMQFGERSVDSILNFSRDADGNLTGSWISFWGVTELKDVKYDANQLSFTQTFRTRDGEMTSKFQGATDDGKLTGTTSSERGESKVVGERAPRISRAAGNWAMTIKAGEREFTGTLAIKSDSDGNLTGVWKSQRGEQKLSDLAYSRGELAFKRTITTPDGEWESAFQGTIRGNTLTGVFKSDRGEAETTGQRMGGPAIGTWNLELDSEFGRRQQRLRINPDMSGLYGSTAIEAVKLDNDQVSFNVSLAFGDRQFEMDFQGKIDGDTLTGELTTGQGTTKVTGKKLVRTFARER
jgi:hypothetical protein